MRIPRWFRNLAIIVVLVGGFIVVNHWGQQSQPTDPHANTSSILALIGTKTKFIGDADASAVVKQLEVESHGAPVLVHFVASWCSACKDEAPELQRFVAQYHAQGIRLVGIASADSKKEDLLVQAANEHDYPLFWDRKGEIAAKFGVSSVPQTMLIDSSGKVRFHVRGMLEPRKKVLLARQIEGILHDRPLAPKVVAGVGGSDLVLGGEGVAPRIVSDFTLLTQGGEPFSSNQLHDKVWVANFIFTTCQTQCPRLTKKMRHVQRIYAGDERLKLVSISVNPEEDTPVRLAAYAHKFNADTEQWKFLTGEWSAIRNLMSHGFLLGVVDNPMFHTEKFVLVGRGMKIRGYYDATSADSLARLHADISTLLEAKPDA